MNTLYRFYANDGTLLYIGITISPPQRFKQHSRDKAWWNEVARIELVQFNSREELENEEKNAISREHPKYNITHIYRKGSAPHGHSQHANVTCHMRVAVNH